MAIKGGSTRSVAIYGLTDPESDLVRYVGRSAQPHERLKQHIREARDVRRDYRKCRWIRSLVDAPGLRILDWATPEDAVAAEGYWIRRLRRGGCDLVNTGLETQGGWTPAAWTASANARRGRPRPISAEGLARQRAARASQVIGPRSQATKAKVSARLAGRKKSSETVERMRLARQGEGAASALLTEDQVLSIRREVERGAARKDVAVKYGVSYSAVTDIVLRRSWRHLPPEGGQ